MSVGRLPRFLLVCTAVTASLVLLQGCAGQRPRRTPAVPQAVPATATVPSAFSGRLSAALPGFPVEIVDGAARAVVPVDRVFEPDAAALRSRGGLDLAPLARLLHNCRSCAASIVVHTDAIGPAEANRQFSEARAAALVAALQLAGAPAARLEGRGAGEAEPVAGQDTPAGRGANRRIEISIRP